MGVSKKYEWMGLPLLTWVVLAGITVLGMYSGKMGIDFGCDSRLKSIIETLIIEYEMDTKTLSLCSGANEDVMCRFLSSTNLVSTEEKYELAVRIMFIYFVFKFPYYEKY